eukprot:56790_1
MNRLEQIELEEKRRESVALSFGTLNRVQRVRSGLIQTKPSASVLTIMRSAKGTYTCIWCMPQVVLQTVFLLSITVSILSIANKYSCFDRQAVVGREAVEWRSQRRCYISWRFLVRQLWRWSDLCARFVILTLLWVCIGGLWLSVYVCLSYLFYYFVVFDRIGQSHLYRLLATTTCIVGIILDYERHFCILRLIDNGVMNTPIVFVFIVMGFAAIELITYPILQSHKMKIIKKTLKGDDDAVPCYSKDEGNRGLSVEDINYFTGKKSNDDCEKLGEAIEEVFKSLLAMDAINTGDIQMDTGDIQMDTGDIAIDFKVFKYGVSVRSILCLRFMINKR